MRRAMLVGLVACACEAERAPVAPPQPTPPTPAPLPSPPRPPTAADTFAATFAPEVVGTLAPAEPKAGDYAMALAMSFEHFVTTELRLDASRTGAMKLTLAADGTARGCAGAKSHSGSQGQMHYERDPAKRRHSSTDSSYLVGLAGSWTVADGIATIRFDHTADACDLAGARESAVVELRCIGVAPGAKIPAGSLICETTERHQLLELGMPMTTAGRRAASPSHPVAPGGTSLVLGAPGIKVDVVQRRTDAFEVMFAPGDVTLTEVTYRPRPAGAGRVP